MLRQRLVLVVLGALFAGVLVAAGPAGAAWAPPVMLSDNDRSASHSEVAIAPDGSAIVVWDHLTPGLVDQVQTRIRRPYGTLTATQNLSGGGSDSNSAQVAVDGSGRAYFVWQLTVEDPTGEDDYRVQGRVLEPDGTLGPVMLLSGFSEEPTRPQVAVSPDGTAVFAWQSYSAAGDWQVHGRRMAAGSLSRVRFLAFTGLRGTTRGPQPVVDINSRPDALVAWRDLDGGAERVFARTWKENGKLSPVMAISAPGVAVDGVQVAAGAYRGTTVVWWRVGEGEYRVESRAVHGASHLDPVITIAPNGGADPQVAVHDNPSRPTVAVFVWRDRDDESVWTRTLSGTGRFTAPQPLSSPGRLTSHPQVAVRGDGHAVYAWLQWHDDTSAYRVALRSRAAGGALGDLLVRSSPDFSAGEPEIAGNAAGKALAVWPQRVTSVGGGCGCDRIQASAGP